MKFTINNLQFTIKSKFSNFKFRNSRTHWRLAIGDWKLASGISLIEILVVVSIFAVMGILVTRSIILTVAGSKRSESLIKVRESLNYSLSVIERQLRNANSIPASSCPNLDSTYLAYNDQNGSPTFFSCVAGGAGVGYIASGSANLTSSQVNVTGCSMVCTPGQGANPPVVTISIKGKDAEAVGTQNEEVTLTSQITLRNY